MRICFIGCVQSSLVALDTLVLLGVDISCVITRASAPGNADHVDLKPFCDAKKIPCFHSGARIEGKSLLFLREVSPDIIFCIGWSSLLSYEVLCCAPSGVIGFHPSPLPYGRGRHPLIWALVLGLTRTASTFFYMDDGIDSGDIISQEPIPITFSDTASDLYARIMAAVRDQLRTFVPLLVQGKVTRVPQNNAEATYWRKRSKGDGCIDFRMTAEGVYNLVRALSKPYPGAHVIYQGREIKIWECRVVADDSIFHEPGKILDVCGNEIVVKCGNNAIAMAQHEFVEPLQAGVYIL